jgi:esterase/lipase superfamily enzyme
MLEPALLFGAELPVGEVLAQLETYPAFEFVVVRSMQGGTTRWFLSTAAKVRWLLDGVAAADPLGDGLVLDETESSRVHDMAESPLPAGFLGVVLDHDELLGASVPEVAQRHVPVGHVSAHRGVSFDGPGVPMSAPVPLPEPVTVAASPVRSPPSMVPTLPSTPSLAAAADHGRVSVVPVFFATDRDASGKPGPEGLFSGGRGSLRFGCIEVNIPPSHERGAVETPSWWKFEYKANPDKHLTLQSAMLFDSEAGFIQGLGRRFAAVGRNDALVFVHGYRVGFDAAVLRTAQIAHDLRFRGAAVLYSWPSTNSFFRYTQDENNATWTVGHFEVFLQLVLQRSGAQRVHVIAHSMGNRVVSEALRNLGPGLDTDRLQQVVLAAPDIDAEVFEQLAAKFGDKARQVTLYASSHDLALRASKLVHGYPRAGDTEPEVRIVPKVVTIDASHAGSDLLGHSYIGDSSSILADIARLLDSGAGPDERRFFLEPAMLRGRPYWIFRP